MYSAMPEEILKKLLTYFNPTESENLVMSHKENGCVCVRTRVGACMCARVSVCVCLRPYISDKYVSLSGFQMCLLVYKIYRTHLCL